MIERLCIRNLALVRELAIEFADGFNVVTGETGAGKSLILGALQILLGDRTSKSAIRRGEEHCEISAEIRLDGRFARVAGQIDTLLEQSGLPPREEGLLLLRRIITPTGNRVYVNSTACTVSVLAALGEYLVDIHGPDNSRALMRPAYQLDLLDAYAGLDDARARCREAHRRLHECTERLEEQRGVTLSEAERELVEFQLNELDEAELQRGEDVALAQRYDVASHARSILETAEQFRAGLSDAPDSVAAQLSEYIRQTAELESVDPERGREFRERLEGIAVQVQDVAVDMAGYAASVDVDEEELQRIEDRLDLVQRLKRKYGGSIEDALAHAESLRERLDGVRNRAERVAELEAERARLQAEHEAVCRELSEARNEAAKGLSVAIGETLGRLGFLQSTFEVGVSPCEPGALGADKIEFGFSPNPGEPVQPLRQIASSGEIARTMLAIKTVLTDADDIPILVFDEVDANIGGRVAHAVAEELAALGRRHQTLCISHLAQIAAAAQRHYRVAKTVEDNRTETRMYPLDAEGRETELTRMLGGNDDSSAARSHARELLGEEECE